MSWGRHRSAQLVAVALGGPRDRGVTAGGWQRGAGTALVPALTQMPRVTVWSPTVITLATKAAPMVWKRRSGGDGPADAAGT